MKTTASLAGSSSLLKIDEVAALLNISVGGVRKLVADGSFPTPIRVGRRALRWRPEDLDAWLAGGGAVPR